LSDEGLEIAVRGGRRAVEEERGKSETCTESKLYTHSGLLTMSEMLHTDWCEAVLIP